VLVSEALPPHCVNIKIEFDFNSYAIRPESYALLNELGKALTNDRIKGKTLILKGHYRLGRIRRLQPDPEPEPRPVCSELPGGQLQYGPGSHPGGGVW